MRLAISNAALQQIDISFIMNSYKEKGNAEINGQTF
jgi:hypothetical protein